MSIDRTQELDKHDNEASSSGEEALRTQYMLMGRLGQGAFSKVRLAYHRLTGVDVAVKEMKRGEYNSLIASEVNVLRMLDHPHVIQLFQVIESEDYIYLVLEHAKSGTLWDKIEHSGRLQEEEARRLFGQVASALCYCHQRGIVHRDLKPDNILLDQAGNVKIADFGLATWFLPGQKLKQGCGVLAFRGPEFYLCQPYDGPKADAWTLGVTLYFMLTAEFPFHGTTYWQLKPQILKGKISLPYYLSTSGRNLIYSLLNYIPWRRPTMEQVLCHPWLTEAAEKPPPIHSSKTLPSHLDPNIMLAMTEMGFDPSQIQDSLLRRRFDEALCIYLMLQRQKCQGLFTGLLAISSPEPTTNHPDYHDPPHVSEVEPDSPHRSPAGS
ncbi:sperm motility kinase Z-like [Castor canadensis]